MKRYLLIFFLLSIFCACITHAQKILPAPADKNKPALLPMPQTVQWGDAYFPLQKCTTLVIQNGLEKEGMLLQSICGAMGLGMRITTHLPLKGPFIQLMLENNSQELSQSEAYRLSVSQKSVVLTATTPHGIFNAIQTLRQLMQDGKTISSCEIKDSPAFSFRGYMVDVGRNFQSVELLKKQIDIMSHYKLNVFHFHATEDIAWRIAINHYPQLTAAENMLRNKGMYYTTADIRELVRYCKERYITFIPEIDMPGHSAAFKRAMHTDMQSDSGLAIVKNMLKEICDSFDVSYIHVGADEVKITNRNFVPEVTSFLEGLGKKVIGWQPGGNYDNSTIRQLWMDDVAFLSGNKGYAYIDSRHLYLNHMDPLEAITTIYNRRIANKDHADANALGATLCVWNDRAVTKQEDVLQMNPVYPGMLAFAERVWQGGGQDGWIANISDGNTQAFTDFENRLLAHKKQYFTGLPFPYVRQSNLQWALWGPYNNEGDVSKAFLPESNSWNETAMNAYKKVTGGTVVLRHWWAPLIKGAIDSAKENTTWYATTHIWSDKAGLKNCWIGFNNLSRSMATDASPLNEWDNKGSAVW